MAALGLALALLSGAQAADSPPNRMTIQSYLTDDSGSPVGSSSPVNKTMEFYIYDQDSGGEKEFAETQIVTVDNGHFSVVLGEGSQIGNINQDLAAVFQGIDASDRYLEIVLPNEGQTLSPRLRLLPAAYAFLAAYANEAATVSSGGVDGAAITDGSVTLAKLANASVDSAAIVNGSITSSDIQNNSITSSDILDNTIATGDIKNNTITNSDIASGTITSGNIRNLTITSADIQSGTITSLNIQNETITSADIDNNTITSADIQNSTITGSDIASNTIGASQIDANAVGSSELANNAVDHGALADNVVRTNELASGLFEFQVYTFPSDDESHTEEFHSREATQWWPILTGWDFGRGNIDAAGTEDLWQLSWSVSSDNDWRLTLHAPTQSSNRPEGRVHILWIPSRMVNDYGGVFKSATRSGDSLQE